MSWNYRLIKHGPFVSIHEVYYDDDGKPVSFAGPPADLGYMANREEMVAEIKLVMRALSLPALDVSVFGGKR